MDPRTQEAILLASVTDAAEKLQPTTIYEKFKLWDTHREKLLEALSHGAGSHTEDDYLVRIAAGEYQIWGNSAGVMVFNYIKEPRFTVLNVRLSAGPQLSGLAAIGYVVMGAAVAQGCKRVMWGGRQGWAKVIPGVQELPALYYKEL